MTISANQTVGELARNVPGSARIFEDFGIDYCCGGGRALRDACEENGLPIEGVLDSLRSLGKEGATPETDWNQESLTALIRHIVGTHHETVRREVPRLEKLIVKMCAAHGSKRPEYLEVQSLISRLAEELMSHLKKEEAVLFPYIEGLESAVGSRTPLPHACFGTVRNPIAMMIREHDDAGGVLESIQGLLKDRTGCPTTQEFFRTLDDFEADLHQHIHLENNILFPRAVELEAATPPIK
ncbi:MAG: iron-sulfur cluster repair di-iron protein [Acidobacteriota bacterium]